MTLRPRYAIALSLLAMAALSGAQVPGGDPAETDLARAALPIEIAASTYYELASMARKLGLSDAGTADELRARLYERYGIEAPASPGEGGRTVTIERASEASYAKVEEEGEIVRASGGVILSLVDPNGDRHRVEADRIAYDRATGSMTARGSVRYERKSGSATEVFTGEALSANVDDWSGVFLDGRIRRSGGSARAGASGGAAPAPGAAAAPGPASAERGVVISADVVTKRSSDVMVLKDGVVTACDVEDPHYSIKAGKIWILGDREWALSNAVFSLGNVPIMWLPFFYYPGEEIAFHPVLGYRTREGRFVQTTTYLIGSRPKKTDKTSILSMIDEGPEKPTKLRGVFLHRVTGPAPKAGGTLKVMADAYSGLGGFVGAQGSLPNLGKLGKTDFFAGLGLSRSLFSTGTGYSPFASVGGWESVWNESSLFGLELPLRYGIEASTSLSLGSLSLNLSLPLYSDPYLDRDFRNRSEDMDWFKVFSQDGSEGTPPSARTQLQPKLDATYSLQTKALSPWLQSISVSKLSSYLSLATKDRTPPADSAKAALLAADPSRKFFYPATLRPFDVSLSLKGSLTPASGTAVAGSRPGDTAPGLELRSPWESPEEAEADSAEGSGEGEASGGGASFPGAFRLPATFGSASTTSAAWSSSTSWSLTPAAYLEESFRSDNVAEPVDIDFARQYSLVSYRLSAAVDGSISYGSDLFRGAMGFSYATQGQERPYIFQDGSAAAAAAAAAFRLADYQARNERVGGKASLSAKPLSTSWLWSQSSLSWSMDATFYNLKYSGMSGGDPQYKETFLGWDDASITSHAVSASLSARPAGLTQSLTLTASLPPTEESYSARLALDAGSAKFTADGRIYRADASDDFTAAPVTAELSVGASTGPRISDTLKYDPEAGEATSNSLSASWGPFSASFSAKRSQAYKPVVGSGWVGYGAETLRAAELAASLKPHFKSAASGSAATWSLDPSISLTQNLQQFSKSALALGLTASLALGSRLTVTLDAQSQNSSAWRYYPGLFRDSLEAAGRGADDFFVDPLEDVWNSISLWDRAALERGLIKLKSLSLSATGDLHDWTLTMKVAANPKLADDGRSYYLDASFSLLLAWKDFSDIKSDIKISRDAGLSY